MIGKKAIAMVVVLMMVLSMLVVLKTFDYEVIDTAEARPGFNEYGDASRILTYGEEYASDAIRIDTSTGYTSGTTYYLYYPTYTQSGSPQQATSFSWDGPFENGDIDYAVNVVANGGNAQLQTGGYPITFNRSGMWILDSDSSHNGGNTNTFAGFIWVNTSTDYSIASIDDFEFGSTQDVTISVTEDESPVGCMIAMRGPDNSTVYHNWQGDGEVTLGPTNFTMAGRYSVHAYRDFDSQDTINLYPDENDKSYDKWYGSNHSTAFPPYPNSSAGKYTYDNVGPWDPPEKNATNISFVVDTGEPTITLTNTTVYWGFEHRIDVNVTSANGSGIKGGTLKLKKGSTYYNKTYVWINETDATNEPGNYSIEFGGRFPAGNWSNLPTSANGTWRVVFEKNDGGTAKQEWNSTQTFSIRRSTPPVRLTLTSYTDNKLDIPSFTGSPPTINANTVAITFQALGRSITGDRAYYGDDAWENWKNITISGDILRPVDATTLTHSGGTNGDWTATVTPTKPGGTITITLDWPGSNNGTATETINIVNGTQVSTAIDEFTVGEHINFTVTVKDMDGAPVKYATVYLFFEGGSSWLNATNGTNKAGKGQNGEYTFWIKPSEQGSTAPRNITIAAKTPGSNFWGYHQIKMVKNHNMMVNVTPTTSYAGDGTEYDIEVSLLDGGRPDKTSGGGLQVKLYDENGELVTGTDAWSEANKYTISDEQIPLSGGTFIIHAYNNTHDSQGQNATLTITAYQVSSSPSVLAWLIDTETNMTFTVTPAANGTLTLKNMSSLPACSDTSSEYEINIEDGTGTLDEVNATTLGNVTYEFTPDNGESRPAEGLLRITTATASPDPGTVYLNEPTKVVITITHPSSGNPIKDVRVGLDHNKSLNNSLLSKLPDDEFTDAEGKARFDIIAEGSGNITIYIENQTDPDNKFVIKATSRKAMKISTDPAVNEGESFTVSAKSNGVLITGTTVTITFAGETYTTTDGTVDITAPTVKESLDYMLTGTAEGYTTDDTTIKVLNVPTLFISVSSTEVNSGETLTIKVGGDDGNAYGITVTLKDQAGTTVASATSAGPDGVTITVPTVDSEKTYTLEATKDGYQDAEPVTITVTPGGIPGFELLTLLAALGVAFILLRRRRH